MRTLLVLTLLATATLAGCLSDGPDEPTKGTDSESASRAYEDAVVVAVVDTGINPYHYDFLASKMPQHQNLDPMDDLPLDKDPATWLPGHPGADAFASYDALRISMPSDADAASAALHDADRDEWNKVQTSSGNSDATMHMRWIPNTKVVGYVNFNGNDGFAATSHGVGTSSVSVGNLHGTCPHCLFVFVNGPREEANEWVAKQSWIDVQTNSFGFSTLGRDRIYAGSDTDLQREAVERGQSIFFSAGNGLANTFTAPNPTLFSSQEGPDWIVTVGAVAPSDGSSYSGHGKPADIASIGSEYPSGGYGDNTVTAEGEFGGTSNATPVTAGLYAEALYRLRHAMEGASRTQEAGVISVGELPCGAENPNCATADGTLTVHELRDALFRAPTTTEAGWNLAGFVTVPAETAEMHLMAEGHGTYWGRLLGNEQYEAEVDQIVGFADGRWYQEMDADMEAWFVADSHCRQSGWGAWSHGYDNGNRTIPASDPAWPTRTWLTETCPTVLPAAVQVERMKDRP